MAAIGAAVLVVSLWLPWYSFRIPAAAIDSAEQLSQQLGALGSLVRAGAQLASQLGPLHVTAWQALSTTPAVVLAMAVIGGGLSVLALAARASGVARPAAVVGVVAIALVGYRIVVHPAEGLLHPAWGIYLGLLGAVAVLAGGLIAGQEGTAGAPHPTLYQLDPYPPEASSGWSAVGSVPPTRL